MIVSEQWLWESNPEACQQYIPSDGVTVVAGYLRVSTEEQATEGYSIETQAVHVREECTRRFPGGCHLLFIADEGVSGVLPIKRAKMKDGEYRPGLTLLSRLIERGHIQAVGVYKCNRLARKLRIWLEFSEDLLEPQDLLFFSCAEGLDNRESGSGLVLSVLMSSAEYEREQIVSAGNDGRLQRRSEGYYLGEPPYGWQWQDKRFLPKHQRVNIEPVPEQGEVILRIIEWYLGGRSPRWIARELTNTGVPTCRGNTLWHKSAVQYVLRDPTNAGLLRDGSGGLVEGVHYPQRILDVSKFEEVQEQMRIRREANEDTNRPTGLMFEHLLKCGICGSRISISSPNDGTQAQYICRGRGTIKHGDFGASVALVESRLEKTLMEAAESPAVTGAANHRIVQQYENTEKELLRGEATLKSRIKRIEQNICIWADRSFSQEQPQDEVGAQLERLGNQRKELICDLERLPKDIRRHKARRKDVEVAASLLKKLPTLWKSMDLDEKRNIASHLIADASFDPQPGHVDLNVDLIPSGVHNLHFYVRGGAAAGLRDPFAITPALLTTAYWFTQGLTTREVADKRGIGVRVVLHQRWDLKRITNTKTIEEALGVMAAVIESRFDELWLDGRPTPFTPRKRKKKYTERQIEFLNLRSAGLSLRETAKQMGISLSTASSHATQVYRKLGAHSITEVLKKAAELGIIDGRS